MGVTDGSESPFFDLLDASPEAEAHTSLAAELALLLGLAALLASPFSLMLAVSASLAALAFLLAMVGTATTSRRDVTGGALAPLGLLFSLMTMALLGLRYLGVDTAVGDRILPDLVSALEFLNSQLPRP